jgi:hypothetical protein
MNFCFFQENPWNVNTTVYSLKKLKNAEMSRHFDHRKELPMYIL